MDVKTEIVHILGGRIRDWLEKVDSEIFEKSQEIRIRVNKPIVFKLEGNKNLIYQNDFKPSFKDISETLEVLGGYSLYSINEEIKNGFISLKGGHRAGIFGKAILNEGKISDMRNISSINIRISHEVYGCGDVYLPFIYANKKVYNTMIISPPGCGKTTLLRDLIRLISNLGTTVAVIDERSEISSENMDLGENTDVLDGAPKVFGMKMALRSMAPQVIAVDEIGTKDDAEAIFEMTCSGVGIVCTAHGESLEGIVKRKELTSLFEKKVFDRYIFLQNKEGTMGDIKSILDGNFKVIAGGG